MTDQRLATAIRLIRIKRGWTQQQLANRARVSRSSVSRMERGHLGSMQVDVIRRVAAALDIRVDLVGRWRAGDLDRLLNARHSALHEQVARMFRDRLPAWVLAPEVSFSVYGERGVIDILAWHPGRRALLVIELKTDVADVNEMVGTVDRKRRLARGLARDRGWDVQSVSVWVILAAGTTNKRRIQTHEAMLRNAFPVGGRAIRAWLRDPGPAVAALSVWEASAAGELHPVRRVRAA